MSPTLAVNLLEITSLTVLLIKKTTTQVKSYNRTVLVNEKEKKIYCIFSEIILQNL